MIRIFVGDRVVAISDNSLASALHVGDTLVASNYSASCYPESEAERVRLTVLSRIVRFHGPGVEIDVDIIAEKTGFGETTERVSTRRLRATEDRVKQTEAALAEIVDRLLIPGVLGPPLEFGTWEAWLADLRKRHGLS